MNQKPLVSVLMSVYNGMPYVEQAVQSILDQNFTNFEFLIVDNASSDSTRELLHAFNDPRISLIENSDNIGPPRALNKALWLAQGTYLARMDADDVALPSRLCKQVDFMESHPEYSVIGTQRRIIDHLGNPQYTTPVPTTQDDLLWRILFTSPFAHSSVMMRREIVSDIGGYNEDLRHAADYELWSRILHQGYQIANLPDQLMLIRVHPDTDGNTANQELLTAEVSRVSRQNAYTLLGIAIDQEDSIKMIQLLNRYDQLSPQGALQGLRVLQTMGVAGGSQANPYYGRTLISLGIFSHNLSKILRLTLLFNGLKLVALTNNRQGRYEFFRTWILSGKLLGALFSGLKRRA